MIVIALILGLGALLLFLQSIANFVRDLNFAIKGREL